MLRNDPEFASKQSGRLTIFVPAVGSPLLFWGILSPCQHNNTISAPTKTSAQSELHAPRDLLHENQIIAQYDQLAFLQSNALH